ncbi:MAG: TolB family protein [Gemmatimonadales bacterium]
MRPTQWLIASMALAGCSVTPITGKIDVGEEAFVIVVGEGPDGSTDLFAAPAEAGKFYRLTFSRVPEARPRLAPSGTSVAFFRRFETGTELVVLDLLSMGERRAPVAAGGEDRIGWSPTGDTVWVGAGERVFGAAAAGQPFGLSEVTAAGRGRGDSLLAEQLGDPVFALVGPCRRSAGPCALVSDSVETALGDDVTDPIRWGADAVGYLRAGRLEVRPLGGGRSTRPNLADPPPGMRQPTHHPGARGAAAPSAGPDPAPSR